ncbi:hypothetical protein DKX38_004950 [Salix brachista]|uniref:Uncharacterized protein n=1 Tax=Salix brachista TaxID=2182728 RepID=A0A5N5NEQ2_9ROSI|nr:hypothetical protein DKX38_004950 [Salix brachista]
MLVMIKTRLRLINGSRQTGNPFSGRQRGVGISTRMKVNEVILVLLALLLLTEALSEAIPRFKHQEITQGKDREEKRSSSGGGRSSRGGGRRSRRPRGSSNCDPLFQYLFGTCGQWPFPTPPSPDNPFQPSPRPSPPGRRAPPLPPLVPSPPPPLPLNQLCHHQMIDEFTPSPPLTPIFSPPSTDQPNMPPDEFAPPPPLPLFNPTPLAPIFSPPVPDDQPPQFPFLPPKEPYTFTPPIESATPNAPDLYFPPPSMPEIPENPQDPLPFPNYVPPAPDAA